jgi:hypothetical protein
MARGSALAFALLLTGSCAGSPEGQGSVPVRPAPGPPTSAEVVEPTSTPLTTASESPPADDDKRPLEPYRLTLAPSGATASTAEEVAVTWRVEGGPRAQRGVVPHVQVVVSWKDMVPVKAGTSAVTQPASSSSEAGECGAPPTSDEKFTFRMQARRIAFVRGSIVGCRDGSPVEETRAKAETRVEWVAPYIAEVEVPGVVYAGVAVQGTIKFNGIDGPKAIGLPKAVKLTSSNPGVTITRQPTVAASSTFEIAVRPDASGEAKLTAEHVNTNGSGKILGVLRKTAIVEIRPRPTK